MRSPVLIALILICLLPGAALAQEQQSKAEQLNTDGGVTPETAGDSEMAERMKRLEETVRVQQETINKQQEKIEKLNSEVKDIADNQEQIDQPFTKYYRISGFYDLMFFKYFYQEDSPFLLYLPQKSTFVINSVNLYINSQMTQTLSSLLELKFTFQPDGFERGFDVEVNGLTIPNMEYEADSTFVHDYYSPIEYKLGGLVIERVHLTYSPVDWFNVLAGRYLTPCGIWNVDHGPTVLIPTRVPYLQTRQMVPIVQTGLQLFGRFFPADTFAIDYALTLSNGRGAIEQVYDLDENKGVGLRLHAAYEGSALRIAGGAYGYYGKYTKISKRALINTQEETAVIKIDTLNEYDEFAVLADLLIEFKGLRLQSEVVRTWVIYTVPEPLVLEQQISQTWDVARTHYAASYDGIAFYLLAAFELPLSDWLGQFRITPYYMYEQNDFSDTSSWHDLWAHSVGLNLKPTPSVVLKIDYTYIHPLNDRWNSNAQNIALQMAVYF